MMRHVRSMLACGILGWLITTGGSIAADPPRRGERDLRFQAGGVTSSGILEGDRVRELTGDLFGTFTKTDRAHALKEVKRLPPTVPTQVLALAGNYKSHSRYETIPPKFQIPRPFFLRSRVNGQEEQQERASRFIHDIASTVSFVSRYITLHPGDLIFTGTPGDTPQIRPGDVVEVELEGVGVLRNPVVAGE